MNQRKLNFVATGTLVCAICMHSSSAFAAPYTFTPLGDLPGGIFSSEANAISADGSVVVGRGNVNVFVSGGEGVAFRWTRDGGMDALGDLPGGSLKSIARGVSADGSVIVGQGNTAAGPEAFRWTAAGGMVGLGDLPGGNVGSGAFDVSADGSVIVGVGNLKLSSPGLGGDPFRWTSGGGMVNLGDLQPSGPFPGFASGVSADGSIVAGRVSRFKAFRWNSADGLVGLDELPGGPALNQANAVSDDGSVIVGQLSSGAFRWTSSDGMVSLGLLPGGGQVPGEILRIVGSGSNDVSADGSVIVGYSTSASSVEAFLWTSGGGMQNLRDLLIAGGATGLTGWTLSEATGISADGRTIVGFGTNPLGEREAWIATVPEPSTLARAGRLWVHRTCRLRPAAEGASLTAVSNSRRAP